VGTRCADHVTPLYPQKLALTSPTGGGRSVGIVRVRTKTTELYTFLYLLLIPGSTDDSVPVHHLLLHAFAAPPQSFVISH